MTKAHKRPRTKTPRTIQTEDALPDPHPCTTKVDRQIASDMAQLRKRAQAENEERPSRDLYELGKVAPAEQFLQSRTFASGATRDTESGKPDFEGFLSPTVLARYGEYMSKHRVQSDGSLRDSDNWQRGIPKEVYIKSALRHLEDWWLEHRGYESREGLEDAICGLLFNAMGYLKVALDERKYLSFIKGSGLCE